VKLIVTVLALLTLTAATSARHSAAPPLGQSTATRDGFSGGTWKVDRRQFPDDQDVWRRRVDAMPAEPTGARAIAGPPDPMLSAPVLNANGLDIALLRTAMRDLLETAERLSFQIKPDSVTITDDLNRTLTYATSGAKEKRQLAATKFDVKTRWNGQALTQEITAWTFGMTEVYLLRDDGQELLVSIKIDKPQFQPPIKNIARVYVRIK
jgi:hypothetical protein